jgi:hypothetical protein
LIILAFNLIVLDFMSRLLIAFDVLLHIVILVNGFSIGARLSSLFVNLVDDVIGYIHAVVLLLSVFKWRSIGWLLLTISAIAGSCFPRILIFLRSLSLVVLPLRLRTTEGTAGCVARLAFRTLKLAAWVMLVTLGFAWMVVLILLIPFDFKSTNTWLFVKPWEAGWFDVEKYFGSSISTLLSIVQVITMDHYMSHIVRPIINVYPQLFLFFLSIQVVGTFGLVYVSVGLAVREFMIIKSELRGQETIDQSRKPRLVQLKIQGLVNRLARIEDLVRRMQPVSNRINRFNT